MNLSSFYQGLVLNIKNIPGRSTSRKIVVIECDDWGGIRMPSKEVYKILHKKGIVSDKDRYMQNDTLAHRVDLELLFELLLESKDNNGNPAVMTAVTNVANPDFQRIKDSEYQEYFFEPFTKTLLRNGRGYETFNTWKKGMELGIFSPELHGREHISVQIWLKKLREGNKNLITGFSHEVAAVSVEDLHPALAGFRPEFYFNSLDQIEFLNNSISDAVNLFRDIFGYTPNAFVPSNSIFHPVFERIVAKAGVKFLNVNHLNPVPDKKGRLILRYYPTGTKTSFGLRYYTRNCAFEPTEMSYRGIDLTMRQIEMAFRWGKPALISTHRVNFIGVLEPSNREKGLKELKLLLNSIVKKWTDVEFMSLKDMFKVLYPHD